jgi:hypothetical protein
MSESDNRTSGIKAESRGSGVQQAVAAHIEDGKQTKEQFLDELVCLHQRISALNPSETQR